MRAKLLTAVAASGLIALGAASTAGAAVTIGQTGTPTTSRARSSIDRLAGDRRPRATPTSCPATAVTGTITSWSTPGRRRTRGRSDDEGLPAAWRRATSFRSSAMTGLVRLTARRSCNTFPASVRGEGRRHPRKQHSGGHVSTSCAFAAPGEKFRHLPHRATLADGAVGALHRHRQRRTSA